MKISIDMTKLNDEDLRGLMGFMCKRDPVLMHSAPRMFLALSHGLMAEFTARTSSPPAHVTHLELRADDMAPKEVEAELFETAEWCNNFSAKLRRMGLPRAAFFQHLSESVAEAACAFIGFVGQVKAVLDGDPPRRPDLWRKAYARERRRAKRDANRGASMV